MTPALAVAALLGVLFDSAAAAMPDEQCDANWPISSGESSATHLSERGLGALFWAVHHPEQAWRILVPIQHRDAAADETSKESDPGDSASRAADPPAS